MHKMDDSKYQWMRDRITRLWPDWKRAAKDLENEKPGFRNRQVKNVSDKKALYSFAFGLVNKRLIDRSVDRSIYGLSTSFFIDNSSFKSCLESTIIKISVFFVSTSKQIFVFMGAFAIHDTWLSNAYKGMPLGEMLQWSDLIASLYILGHNITLSAEKESMNRYTYARTHMIFICSHYSTY